MRVSYCWVILLLLCIGCQQTRDNTPTPPTPVAAHTAIATPTLTATSTPPPTATPTRQPTVTPTPSLTRTPSPIPTATPTATNTPTPRPLLTGEPLTWLQTGQQLHLEQVLGNSGGIWFYAATEHLPSMIVWLESNRMLQGVSITDGATVFALEVPEGKSVYTIEAELLYLSTVPDDGEGVYFAGVYQLPSLTPICEDIRPFQCDFSAEILIHTDSYPKRPINDGAVKVTSSYAYEDGYELQITTDSSIWSQTYVNRPSWLVLDDDLIVSHNKNQLTRHDGQTGEVVWTTKTVSDDFHAIQLDFQPLRAELVQHDGDVLVHHGYQLTRFNGQTGDPLWQTTTVSEGRHYLLIDGDYLWSGSDAGYVHLFDVRTGKLLWEQDVWATSDAFTHRVRPWIVSDNKVIVLSGFLSSAFVWGTNDDVYEPQPTRTPRPTPTPIPTAIVTPAPAGELPTLPDQWQDWLHAIVLFLNTQPDPQNRFEQLIAQWLTTGNLDRGTHAWLDLDGDAVDELVLAINAERTYGCLNHTMLAIVQQNSDETYEIVWQTTVDNVDPVKIIPSPEDAEPHIVILSDEGFELEALPSHDPFADLNGDGLSEVVFRTSCAGNNSSAETYHILTFHNDTFRNMTPKPIKVLNGFWQSGFVDINDDGVLDFVATGSDYHSRSPRTIATYLWSETEQAYVLHANELSRSQPFIYYLLFASDLLQTGKYQKTVDLLIDNQNASAQNDRLLALAELQLMLAYIQLGDLENARIWAQSTAFEGELYQQAKQLFWEQYVATGEWTSSAEIARTRIRMAGWHYAQPSVPTSYRSPVLQDLNDFIPCPNCIQGYFGSFFDQ